MSTTRPNPFRIVARPPETIPGPCPHGYAWPGNCTQCTPPPNYAPLNGDASH